MREIAINDIVTSEFNPNVMRKSDREKLKELIEIQKEYPALIVNWRDGKYRLLDGHQRLSILKELGYDMIKCDIWSVDETTELTLLNTLNNLRGKDLAQKKERLFKELSGRLSQEQLAKLTVEKTAFIKRVYDDVVEEKRRLLSEAQEVKYVPITDKIMFHQHLTKEQYEIVMEYLRKHDLLQKPDEAIFSLVVKLKQEEVEKVEA